MAFLEGLYAWGVQCDETGHRNYRARFTVRSTNADDGPFMAMQCPGLPTIGSPWIFGNDNDPWAFCWPNWSASPFYDGEKNLFWYVDIPFSTKPMSRCQDTSIENPLDEPPRVGGTFVKYTKEASRDRHGKLLKSSSHEMYKGAIAERDYNRPTVDIEITLLILPLSIFAGMIDSVNDASLWGLGPRMIKLSNASWQRHLYGTCTFYYTVAYSFDIDFKTFDRRAVDEGTRFLPPWIDPMGIDTTTGKFNWEVPSKYIVIKDGDGENLGKTLLNGQGGQLVDIDAPIVHTFELYDESNFLLLNIPTSF